MGANPAPMNAVWHREPEGSVVEANADAVILAVSNCLEVQRWVRRIDLELGVVSVCESLNVSG